MTKHTSALILSLADVRVMIVVIVFVGVIV